MLITPYRYCESQWEEEENKFIEDTYVQPHRCMIKMYGKKENKIETYLKMLGCKSYPERENKLLKFIPI